MCLFAICVSSLVQFSLYLLAYFIGWYAVLLNFERVFLLNYYSAYKAFVKCVFFFKVFPQSMVCFFILLVSFAKHKFLTLMMLSLSIFSFPHCAFAVSFKKSVHLRIQNFLE